METETAVETAKAPTKEAGVALITIPKQQLLRLRKKLGAETDTAALHHALRRAKAIMGSLKWSHSDGNTTHIRLATDLKEGIDALGLKPSQAAFLGAVSLLQDAKESLEEAKKETHDAEHAPSERD